MPFAVISVVVERPSAAMIPDGASGYKKGPPILVEGSPFRCRLYRNRDMTVARVTDASGVTTIEQRRALQFLDLAAPVKEGDLATLPGGEQVRIIRRRQYGQSLQCDVESGNEQENK